MIRKLVPLGIGMAVVLVPQAAWADEAKAASTLNVPLLVAGGLVLATGAILLVAGRLRPWAIALLAAGVVVGGLGFVLPRLGGGAEASAATVSIVEPESGAEVPAGEPVTVEVALRGGTIATSPTDHDGGHLHLYVDGDLQQMPYSRTIELELDRGQHVLKVEYVDHEHVSFDPEIATTIQVTAV